MEIWGGGGGGGGYDCSAAINIDPIYWVGWKMIFFGLRYIHVDHVD